MVNNNATNTTWNADAQCLSGYQGVLCGTCANDYVRRGDDCDYCPGGWQIGNAIGSVLASCVVVFIISFVLVKRTKTLDKHKQHDIVEEISAQFKILTSWLQILSVLTKTFNAVPWGSSFTSFSQSSGTVVNLDLSFLSSMATCSLSLPFLEQYGLSTLYPIAITVAVKLGQCLAMVNVKDVDRRLAQSAQGDKIFLLFIMLLFPSIANKSFTVFRCREIPGLEYTVLDEDFSVVCWEGHHTVYVVVACLSIAVCKWVWYRGGCGCANVSNISLLSLSLQMPSVYHCICSSNCTAIDVIFTPPTMVLSVINTIGRTSGWVTCLYNTSEW
jgi:hypothetical protein